jgi:nucleoside-diphosphate-sugar epimerase
MLTEAPARRRVFVTGGSGYLGRPLIAALAARGHDVRALVRPASRQRLPPGCEAVLGDALDHASFAGRVAPADTFVHLVGVAHPSPSKARQFETIDLAAIRASVAASVAAGIEHFVYVSAAQPAPVMRAYVAARAAGEASLRASSLPATILRPWYVLGPGHRWPALLLPLYWLLERLPRTRATAHRLGLVRLEEMVRSLVHAVEHPPSGVRVVEVPEIRAAASSR